MILVTGPADQVCGILVGQTQYFSSDAYPRNQISNVE